MMTDHVLLAGLLVGFSIAVPIGPMGLLCIQRTLASGMRVGVSTGLGAATVNVVYGGVIILGLGQVGPMMTDFGRGLSVVGGLFLLWTAARTVRRGRRVTKPTRPALVSPWSAYGSAVAYNATNPMSLMLIVALMSPILRAGSPSPGDATMLLLGMFMAATAWWVCLSGGVSLLRARLNPRVLAAVNQGAAFVLTLYGALALARGLGP